MKTALRVVKDEPHQPDLLALIEVTGTAIAEALPRGILTAAQAEIILRLGDDPVSVKEIMHSGVYSGCNATYNLARLKNLGYVRQRVASYDRRVVLISLTPSGAMLRGKLSAALVARMEVLTPDEVGTLRRLLKKLRDGR